MNKFVETLNQNCENRNERFWKRWTVDRLSPNRQLYCVEDDAGARLCYKCNEDIVDEIHSSFDTVLCDDCCDKFSHEVIVNGGFVQGTKLLEWLTSTSWICYQCETKLIVELKENSAKDLESRVAAIENMLQKISQKMGIPKE